MKFQFLPHYVKYIGLMMYIVYLGTSCIDDFIAGFNMEPYDPDRMSFGLEEYLNKKLFDFIGFAGILLYALSKR